MDRIEKLRSRVFDSPLFSDEFYYYFYKEYDRLSDLPEEQKYAEAFFYAFANLTPSISDSELIVGKRDVQMSEEIRREWDSKIRNTAEARRNKAGGGQDSHMAIDYDLLLSLGINGIIEKINSYMQSCSKEKLSFYKCCKKCLEAVIKHSENYSETAKKMSLETDDPVRRAELEKISEICRNVPANPAENFYEAVQSVHFVSHCLSLNPFRLCWQQFQLGRPDRYLYRFYQKDIENGTITKNFAQLLLDCLGIQINMRVPNGLSCGYMVGGVDKDGNVTANELTGMCMQVIDDIRLVYPSVGFCHTKKMPEEYLEKACSLLLKGYSHPAIFNDDLITKGLICYGVPEDEAHDYIHSTCVEITPAASSNVWVASPYTNMVQLLLDSMDREYASFDELVESVFEKLDVRIKQNFEKENRERKVRCENSLNPLLSCFVNDCLERGLDIEKGGAKYNWIMPSFVGMANLVDSLYAVRKTVFEEKRMTLCGLKEILDCNFDNNEALRLHLLRNIPKYGNDIDAIDSYFPLFTEHLVSECKKYVGTHSNGKLIPSVFCWVMHERFGRETSATPDGRKAGFPLGDGSGACQGREMNGPTASILSATKWEHCNFIGGVAVNLKFSKASLGAKSCDTVKSIIKTYLNRGGFEIQVNVLDNETLRKAQKNPEDYKDLVVRIGGYSDYFVTLSPEMQEEVILRTAHNA